MAAFGTLLWISTSILRPRLTHASIVWWGRDKQKTVTARLERLRGLILRVITGASKSSPTMALGALMGLEPLHLTITAKVGKANWRIGENSQTVISKKQRTTGNIAKRPIMKMVSDRTSPRYLFDKKYKVSLSTMEDWKVDRAHLPGDGDNWFADGSKNREGTGAGVYGKTSDTSLVVPLGPQPTVLQTTIAAILQCACVSRNYIRGGNIRICLDSRAPITTLTKSVTTSKLVWEYYEALNKLAKDNQVTVLWTPGHRGIKGNETADRLAKLVTKQNPTGLEPVIGISKRSVT